MSPLWFDAENPDWKLEMFGIRDNATSFKYHSVKLETSLVRVDMPKVALK